MKPFTLLIKPASSDCNLRCQYCFYLDHWELYPETKIHRMSDNVLERMIASYLATPQPQYGFGWQGGEPTLMGVDFFRRVTELQRRHGRAGSVVSNGLQTNATLINDAFAEHLAEYKFLLGISLDGPSYIHDRFRRNQREQGSHARVMRGIECCRKHGVEFNILTLVSRSNVGKAREVYRYLCNQGFMYHQYIPCVEFDADSAALPYTITGEEWGAFLCELYDEWMKADTRRVSVRLFDSVLTWMVEGSYSVCRMGNNCCQYFVVEYNGDIYPCDFFVRKDLRIGNVTNLEWQTALDSPVYREFGARKAEYHSMCAECEYEDLCHGDCLKHRVYNGRPPNTLSWLCAGWKRFYRHALPGFRKLAETVREERRRQQHPMPQSPHTTRPGRNDPCPCGSGKKYKRCCGAIEQ